MAVDGEKGGGDRRTWLAVVASANDASRSSWWWHGPDRLAKVAQSGDGLGGIGVTLWPDAVVSSDGLGGLGIGLQLDKVVSGGGLQRLRAVVASGDGGLGAAAARSRWQRPSMMAVVVVGW